jgi:hypothetical protein
MKQADEILDDEELINAVYEALRCRQAVCRPAARMDRNGYWPAAQFSVSPFGSGDMYATVPSNVPDMDVIIVGN